MNNYEINNSQYKTLTKRIFKLPLWVRQAIYCELKVNIASCSDVSLLDRIETDIIQLYKPSLSKDGNRLFLDMTGFKLINESQYRLLENVKSGMNMLEIAHNLNISLKSACLLLLELIELNFIEDIKDESAKNFVLFLTGNIRLGEFLVRTGRISNIDLDKALYTKKCADEIGSELSFKEILVNFGYISKREIDNILSIKISAEQPVSVLDEAAVHYETINMLQDELEGLMIEKQKLKEDLERYKKEFEMVNNEKLELTKQLQKYTKGFMGKLLTSLS